MNLKCARDMQAKSLDNQPEFQQLIIPGMEEFLEKINHKLILFGVIDDTFRKGGFINIWVSKTDKGKTRPYKHTCSICVKCSPQLVLNLHLDSPRTLARDSNLCVIAKVL